MCKKFGLGPKFLCHPRGNWERERHKKFGPRVKLLVPPKRQQGGKGDRWHKKFGHRAKLLVPPRRQLGGRGADVTRRLALGLNFLCHPRGSRRGRVGDIMDLFRLVDI